MTRLIKEWRGKYANIDSELQLIFINEASRHLEAAYSAIGYAAHLLWLMGKEEASKELSYATSYIVQAKIKIRRMEIDAIRRLAPEQQAEKEEGTA